MEFIAVEYPTMFPQACVACTSQKGPIADTFRDLPGYGHVYVCERCAKSFARIFGYSDGKRLDELENASKLLVERERDLSGMTQELARVSLALDDAEHQIADLKEKLRDSDNRTESLRAAMKVGAEQFAKVAG
jgi:septal ring factor EnvC (AmiA/AmiB activator)